MPGIFSRKAPFDLGASGVALRFQLLDFSLERFFLSDASVQTLTTEDAQLNLGDIQPTAMLRRVMKLQFAKYPPRLRGREGLVQRRCLVRVQVVEYDSHPLGFREANVNEPLNLSREVFHRPLLSN